MTTSEQTGELAAALAKAQGEMGAATKDAANPFFKSRYADLSSIIEASRGALTKNGIAVIQVPSSEGARVTVATRLLHASGQWIEGEVSATAKDATPQSVGSSITYLRRYALQSFVGVATADDDGESAQPERSAKAATERVAANAPVTAPTFRR